MVSGDTKIERQYWKPDTNEFIDVEMTIRDHILFDLLKKIEGAIKAKK